MLTSIAVEYGRRHGGINAGVRMFVADLMRGNPAECKVGYTYENAVLAAAEAFGLDPEQVREIQPEDGEEILALEDR